MKKEDQITRIEGFLNSLEYAPMGDGQQALVLQPEFSVIGGAANGKCTNHGSGSCGLSNGTCVNNKGCGGDNRTCSNGGIPGPDGAQ